MAYVCFILIPALDFPLLHQSKPCISTQEHNKLGNHIHLFPAKASAECSVAHHTFSPWNPGVPPKFFPMQTWGFTLPGPASNEEQINWTTIEPVLAVSRSRKARKHLSWAA